MKLTENLIYFRSPESLFELKQREPSPIDEALAETSMSDFHRHLSLYSIVHISNFRLNNLHFNTHTKNAYLKSAEK